MTMQLRSTTGLARYRRLTLAAVVSTTMLYSPFSTAIKFTELSTQQLDEIRGKYVSTKGNVVYFGVTMETQWSTPVETHTVAMEVGVDNSGQQASTTLKTYGTLGTQVDDDEFPDQPATATDNISGTVQSIQVAGDDNHVQNNVSVAITDVSDNSNTVQVSSNEAVAPPPTPTVEVIPEPTSDPVAEIVSVEPTVDVAPEIEVTSVEPVVEVASLPAEEPVVPVSVIPESTVPAAADTQNVTVATTQPVNEPMTKTFKNDQTLTQVVVDDNQLGYTIVSGEDVVVQRVGNSTGFNANQLVQSVTLSTSGNQIMNSIRLRVDLDSGSRLRQDAMKLNANLLGLR